jgi:hypothetical protein
MCPPIDLVVAMTSPSIGAGSFWTAISTAISAQRDFENILPVNFYYTMKN